MRFLGPRLALSVLLLAAVFAGAVAGKGTNAPGSEATWRASVGQGGEQANAFAIKSTISDDGARIAFVSLASNLVPGDTAQYCWEGGGTPDLPPRRCSELYVRDSRTGDIWLANKAPDGHQPNGSTGDAQISGNGGFVVFISKASNLVAGDTNGVQDVFLTEIATGLTERVSVASDGTQQRATEGSACGFMCGNPSVNRNGLFVAWDTWSDNLVAGPLVPGLYNGDANEKADVFLRDRQAGTTRRISVSSDGVEANDASVIRSWRALSDDGARIVFHSLASNLVANDDNHCSAGPFPEGNSCPDVFVHDTATETTRLVSVSRSGDSGNEASCCGVISGNGRYVAFISTASDLVPGLDLEGSGVYIRDLENGTTRLVSVAKDGTPSRGTLKGLDVSRDGRYVAFGSTASDLVDAVLPPATHAFVRDLENGVTVQVDVATGGQSADKDIVSMISISGDASVVAFDSAATNLVAGDTNGVDDVFASDVFRAGLNAAPRPPNGDGGRGVASPAEPFTLTGVVLLVVRLMGRRLSHAEETAARA